LQESGAATDVYGILCFNIPKIAAEILHELVQASLAETPLNVKPN
jgi:hypothetical protein